MVPTSRRRFLAAGGGLLALSGCLSRESDDEDRSGALADADDVPSAVAQALDPIPATVDGAAAEYLTVLAPEDSGEANSIPLGFSAGVGLEPESVDRTATARYRNDSTASVSAFVGSFGADDPDDPEEAATYAEDGIALAATTGGDPWDDGLEAAQRAFADAEVGVAAERPVETLIEPIADRQQVILLPSVDEDVSPEDAEIDPEAIAALGVGIEMDVEARERRMTYVVVFESEADADESSMEAVLSADAREEELEDVEIEMDGRRALATITEELSPSQLPDDSPDAWFRIRYDAETGDTVLEQTGEEAVDAANLELRVDGEPADPPWADDAEIEPGDSFELDAPLFSHVEVRWIDPEREDVYQPLGQALVGGHDAFEGSYDGERGELTITYTGEETVDPSRFELEVRTHERETEHSESLDDRVETLAPDDQLVIEDVSYGEHVTISVSQEHEDGQFSQSVFWHNVRPPGHFRVEQEGESRVLTFRGEEEAAEPASNYRVTVDGEPADTQWADAHDVLADGDAIELDVEAGEEVVVEYVGADEPFEMLEHTARPSVEFEFDVGEDAVEITHAGGDAVDAEELVVLVHPLDPPRRPDVWAEAHDTVEEGDSVVVEYAVEADGDDGSTAEDDAADDDATGDESEEEPTEPEVVAVMYRNHPLDYRELEADDEDEED